MTKNAFIINLSVINSTHYFNEHVTENVSVNEIVCGTTNEGLLKKYAFIQTNALLKHKKKKRVSFNNRLNEIVSVTRNCTP